MNYGTLQSRVVDYLDRTDLTTRIKDWINDTRKDLATKYNFDYLYVESTCSTVAGSARYAIPDDFLDHMVIMINDKKLHRIGAKEFDEIIGMDDDVTAASSYLYTTSTEESGTPDYYVDRGMEIELYPKPDIVYTLTMKYYAQPTDFTLDADNDYISKFHFEAIIFGAALRGAIFLDDEAKKATFAPLYASCINEMIKKEKERTGRDIKIRWKSWKDFDLGSFKRMMKVSN